MDLLKFQDEYMEALAKLHMTVTRAYKVCMLHAWTRPTKFHAPQNYPYSSHFSGLLVGLTSHFCYLKFLSYNFPSYVSVPRHHL